MHRRLDGEGREQIIDGSTWPWVATSAAPSARAACTRTARAVSPYRAVSAVALVQTLAMMRVDRRPACDPGVPGCHARQ